MTIKEPIVEGEWYLTDAGDVHRARKQSDGWRYGPGGSVFFYGEEWCQVLVKQVWITPTDPAEVVAELQRMAHICSASAESAGSRAFDTAADLVAEKLGVK